MLPPVTGPQKLELGLQLDVAAHLALFLAVLPTVTAIVPSCSFSGVECKTCLGRYTTGSSYQTSTTTCGWCAAKSLNASDLSSVNGYCLEVNDVHKAHKCQGQKFIQARTARAAAAACDPTLPPEVFVGIAVGVVALISAGLCYWRATKHSGSRQFKWILAGILLPVLSVVIVEILAAKGHFRSSATDNAPSLPRDNPSPETYGAASPSPDATFHHSQPYGVPAGSSSVPSMQQQGDAHFAQAGAHPYSNTRSHAVQQQDYSNVQPSYSSDMRPP